MKQGLNMTYFCLALVALVGLSMMTMASASADDESNPQVVLETNLGNITLQLDRSKAPTTVDNFLKYVDSGFYNGLCFHRVIPNFMIQGGGFTPDAKRPNEAKKTNEPIKNEATNGLKNDRGTIAMARTSDPHSATSQFFINLKDNRFLDRDQAADGYGYTVFGKVVDGMDTVNKIAAVPTEQNSLSEGCPRTPVVIRTAKRKAAK